MNVSDTSETFGSPQSDGSDQAGHNANVADSSDSLRSAPVDSAGSPDSVAGSVADSVSQHAESQEVEDVVSSNGLDHEAQTSDAASTAVAASTPMPASASAQDDPSGDGMGDAEQQSGDSSPQTADSMEPKGDMSDQPKKARAPRAPKAAAPKSNEAGGSVGAIVERVVRLSGLDDVQTAALGRLLNVGLPEDQIARLTRLTTASLGPSGTNGSEALATVLGLESANPIHVGVQLGRLAPTALPDVYRCVFALTGQTAPALPRGDSAVFAVADALATLTSAEFVLAKALTSALE